MCPPPLKLLLLPLLLWLDIPLVQCEPQRNTTYVTYNLTSVCPQLRPGALDYTDNDVYKSSQLPPTWDQKTINLGLGVAALIDETLNGTIFQKSSAPVEAIDCVFEVRTGPESAGIFVVLSHLNALRRWSNGSCQDYLRINYANFYSESICGDPIGQAGESIRSFDSSIGVVKVRLHLDNSNTEDGRRRSNFQFRLKLVLTSYFDCAKEREGFSCTNTNERCIPKEYVRDGIINCGMPSCRDELNCLNMDFDQVYNNLSITVLIGLSSFISTGLLFGVFLWFCLKKSFKERLNSAVSSAPNYGMELSSSPPTDGGGRGGGSNRHRRNSSEGINAAAAGSSSSATEGAAGVTADPPPSYDILFPDK